MKFYNEQFNLTAISDSSDIIKYHFQDSLMLSKFIDLSSVEGLCDIGSGGGFPGIPLKILLGQQDVYLIEVIKKKIFFLNEVIKELGLEKIQVIDLDWRTFLRKTNLKIDLFCARASLEPAELLKIYKPSSSYQNSILTYWASKDFDSKPFENFILKEDSYKIGPKLRKLIFFKSQDKRPAAGRN